MFPSFQKFTSFIHFQMPHTYRPISQREKLVHSGRSSNIRLLLFIKSRMNAAQTLQNLSYKVCSNISPNSFGIWTIYSSFGMSAIIYQSLLLSHEDILDSSMIKRERRIVKMPTGVPYQSLLLSHEDILDSSMTKRERRIVKMPTGVP